MTTPNTTGAQALSDDMVLIPRSLIGAACAAIRLKHPAEKTLAELRRYTFGDLSSREQAGAVAPRWIIARQTVIDDLPGSRPLLGYTVFADPFTTFETAEQASEALQELKLPLGWVRMMTDQEPWASLFPPVWSQAAIAAREQESSVADELLAFVKKIANGEVKDHMFTSLEDEASSLWFRSSAQLALARKS